MKSVDDVVTCAEQMFRDQFDLSVALLRQSGREDLAEKMQRRWYSMFYNDPLHTLKKGKAYLIGLNPGGSDSRVFNTGDEITNDCRKHNKVDGKPYSSYIDQAWNRDKGKSPHQINVRKVLHRIIQGESEDADTRSTFAANLCFFRTPNTKMLMQYPDWRKLLKHCWQHHERFLSIVQPEIIICNGNSEKISAFSETKRYLAPNAEIHRETVNKKRSVKWFRSRLVFSPNKESVLVLGVPHLSQPYASMDAILGAIDRIMRR